MNRSDRILLGAVGVSAVLHLLALVGTPVFEPGLPEHAPQPPIEARIVTPPPPVPPPASKPTGTQRRAERKVQTAATPLREAVVPTYEYPVLDPLPAIPSEVAREAAPEPVTAAAEAPAEPVALAVEYPLRSARLVFDLYFGSTLTKVGQVTHTWAQDGARYRVESVAEAVGFVSLFLGGRFVQQSSGALGAGGLLPAEYRAEATKRERRQAARFDWPARKVALADRDQTRLLDLPDGAQDPLSAVHQLWFMQPIAPAARLDIATGRKLYEQVYRVVGETQLETPLGMVRALQLSRRDADGERMDVWLDLDRDLLPARIHFVDRRGMVLQQVIREATVELTEVR